MDNNLEQRQRLTAEIMERLLPPECKHLYFSSVTDKGIKQPTYVWLEKGQLHIRSLYISNNGSEIHSYDPTYGEDCTRSLFEYLKGYFEPSDTEIIAQTCDNLREFLDTSVKDFDFTVRALNCMVANDIFTVRDLVRHKRADLLKTRNFGKRSLTEIDEWLNKHNLHFGMEV